MTKPVVRLAFTDFWRPEPITDLRAQLPAFHRLLSQRFTVELGGQPDFVVFSCFGTRFMQHDCTRIFYTGENVRPDFRRCDYAFSFDFPTTERNYRLPLYKLYTHYPRIFTRHLDPDRLQKDGFCSFVYSNAKAPERLEFLQCLERYRSVRSGGRLRNNVGGPVRDKLDFLKRHRFTIAFENSIHPGYTTEKILDAFVANTVPIYWGNPLVGRDFNPDSFINCHDFESFEAVVDHVRRVDQDETLYRRYLDAPPFRDNREPDFLRDESILDRFEQIFSGPRKSGVAGPIDPVWRYALPETWIKGGRRLGRALRKGL